MPSRFPSDRSPRPDERTIIVRRGPVAGGGSLQPGVVLGRTYRVEALLGRGALGETYRARHIELGTAHTIKLLPAALADDPKFVQLLVDEARQLVRVQHDAIARYEGLFRDDGGLRYLVTEFIEGPTLRAFIAARRLEPDEVLRLRDRLIEGLAAVHARGMIHRDVSPENIILPGGEIGRAKLTEFGLATSGERRDATLIGAQLAAHFAFASPEQLGLFGGKIDSRSDIYSLGLVLAAAALGFGKTLDMGQDPATALEARRKPPDLSAVPPSLRTAIAPMLQPRPDDRPASVRALVEAAPEGAVSTAGAAASQRLFAIAAAGAVMVLVVGAALFAFLRIGPLAGTTDTELRSRVEAALSGYSCSAISYTLAPGHAVRLSGHVASAADLDRLRRDVGAISGVSTLDVAVELMPPPHCAAAALLQPLTSDPDGAAIAFADKADHRFIGERPSLAISAPDFDSFIYVDYFDSGASQVLHLFPNGRDAFNLRPWRNHFVLFKQPLWTLCGNAGRQLITLTASTKALFSETRPPVEAAHDYLTALGEALRGSAGQRRVAALLFFDLRNAPPWINQQAACPGS